MRTDIYKHVTTNQTFISACACRLLYIHRYKFVHAQICSKYAALKCQQIYMQIVDAIV